MDDAEDRAPTVERQDDHQAEASGVHQPSPPADGDRQAAETTPAVAHDHQDEAGCPWTVVANPVTGLQVEMPVRKALSHSDPQWLVAHEDLLIFQPPGTAASPCDPKHGLAGTPNYPLTVGARAGVAS